MGGGGSRGPGEAGAGAGAGGGAERAGLGARRRRQRQRRGWQRAAAPQGRGMGRVQLFEVRLSHGRVVYSPGEPLAGAVRVRLAAPLPFRGGRGVREGPHLRRAGRGSEAARGRWARDPRGRGRASGCGERRGAAGRAADRGGGRPAAVGAEQGGPGGPVLPHLPFLSSPPRAVQTRGAGFEPVYFAEGHSDLDPRRL